MKKIGLTGGIGSGKSFIANVLIKMGYPVYNSDQEAKILTQSNPDIRKGLIERFGKQIFEGTTLNKKQLAEFIFNDESHRIFVNGLVHPVVRSDFNRWCLKQNTGLVFNEAAILFETGAYQNFDSNVLVMAPIQLRIDRVVRRDACTPLQAQERIEAQWSDEEKIKLASFCIHNDGSPLLVQIEQMIEFLSSINNQG